METWNQKGEEKEEMRYMDKLYKMKSLIEMGVLPTKAYKTTFGKEFKEK